jgi:hypothetical protein
LSIGAVVKASQLLFEFRRSNQIEKGINAGIKKAESNYPSPRFSFLIVRQGFIGIRNKPINRVRQKRCITQQHNNIGCPGNLKRPLFEHVVRLFRGLENHDVEA